jgi:hypothetical protein
MACLRKHCLATLPRGVNRNAVQQPAGSGAARLGSARHGENTAFLIVALRVFGHEVFNGQLLSNAVTIHVTIYIHYMFRSESPSSGGPHEYSLFIIELSI